MYNLVVLKKENRLPSLKEVDSLGVEKEMGMRIARECINIEISSYGGKEENNFHH